MREVKRGILALALLWAIFLFSGSRCEGERVTRVTRGDSLSGVLESGVSVTLVFGYYDCRPVARGDLVAFRYSQHENLIIKTVKAVPGDAVQLERSGTGWYLRVNDKLVRAAREEPYFFGVEAFRVIEPYLKEYENRIPLETFLVFGEVPSGSLDSAAFGPLGRNAIVAKVIAE